MELHPNTKTVSMKRTQMKREKDAPLPYLIVRKKVLLNYITYFF
jgi:hypothetical protein